MTARRCEERRDLQEYRAGPGTGWARWGRTISTGINASHLTHGVPNSLRGLGGAGGGHLLRGTVSSPPCAER